MELVLDKWNRTQTFYQWALTRSDKRTDEWLLIQGGIGPVLAISIIYVTFVTIIGPRLMEKREAFKLKRLLMLYNVFCVCMNFHIVKELIYNTTMAGYTYLKCQGVDYSNDEYEVRVAKALWWYYFSKLIEMLDTVFFIVRKKNNQVSFLHVYHHTSMFIFNWIIVKWFAGGGLTFGAILNSMVHVLMYTYYGIAGLGPEYQKYIWWKRYMTIIQLIQFIVGMTHGLISLATGCPDYAHVPVYIGMTYVFTILLLFLNFYVHAYIKTKNHKSSKSVQNGARNGVHNGVSNGISNGEQNGKARKR